MARPTRYGIRKKHIGFTLTPQALEFLALTQGEESLPSLSESVELLIRTHPKFRGEGVEPFSETDKLINSFNNCLAELERIHTEQPNIESLKAISYLAMAIQIINNLAKENTQEE